MNTNSLRDTESGLGLYLAACGVGTARWPGATIFRSVDAGLSYQVAGIVDVASTIGVSAFLSSFSGHPNTVDESSTVNVVLTHGTLDSVSYAAFLSGVNTAIIGSEILLFRTAILETNGSYTLSGLLRGRRGTESFISSHIAGERFVLASAATMKWVAAVSSDIGVTTLVKAVTGGSTLASATAQSFTFEGRSVWPYAPCHLGGSRSGSDVILTWIRRNRTSGEWASNVDVPMTEASESYVVEIYNSTYTTVRRTLTASTPTVVYTEAQQTTDFGAAQGIVYFKVYQLSAVVGRGYAATGLV